ncbi:MAG: YtxH domain-containing protein [Bacteroidetes bacterium]|nr:YtxH domain-containing protein [Bacteroidota bacterium]
MAHEEDGFAKGLFLGFIAGSAIGAVTALLLAPKSGEDLRKDIQKKSTQLKETAQAQLRQARAKAEQLVNEGKKRSDEIVGQAKQLAGSIVSDAEKVLDQAKGEGGKFRAAVKAGADAFKEERGKNS